jgi:hypothetical protein
MCKRRCEELEEFPDSDIPWTQIQLSKRVPECVIPGSITASREKYRRFTNLTIMNERQTALEVEISWSVWRPLGETRESIRLRIFARAFIQRHIPVDGYCQLRLKFRHVE